ncbi:hypothetical protein [Kordia zhangzhouensis]|uniref:hypothetical protein n=1 Tax=Kordia zhangzhouensis TaxID=1620405 RepID=UPI0006296611|nr:hypothetical protein [Kordia zhangzhouensis]
MKKQNLKKLDLKKASVSNLSGGKTSVDDSITTLRFICTNHPTQVTKSPYCQSEELNHTCACVTNNNEYSCQCTIA